MPTQPVQPQDRRPKKTTTRRSSTRTSPAGSEPEEKYSPTTWGAGASGEVLEDITVPSGQLCLVRRPGVEGLLKAGVLHQLDTLTQLVQSNLDGKSTNVTDETVMGIMNDPEKLASMMQVLDKILIYIVVKPEIQSTPDDVTRRENGVIYADMVDLMDKMFLMNYAVGGTRDLERFRGEHADAMGSLAAVQGGAQASKRTSSRAPRT
jgi:hypothetical protein